MSDWLYPLSSQKDAQGYPRYHFELRSGQTTPDTSARSLRLIVNDGPGQGPWVVHLNRVSGKVQPRDRVWFYYGLADADLGIVALGTVTDLDEVDGVSFRWQKTATRRLLNTPVPAAVVRQYVHRPRAALWPLDPHPTLVRKLLKAAGI